MSSRSAFVLLSCAALLIACCGPSGAEQEAPKGDKAFIAPDPGAPPASSPAPSRTDPSLYDPQLFSPTPLSRTPLDQTPFAPREDATWPDLKTLTDPPDPGASKLQPPKPRETIRSAAARPAAVPVPVSRRAALRRKLLNAQASVAEDIRARLREKKVRAWPCMYGGICNWQRPVEPDDPGYEGW